MKAAKQNSWVKSFKVSYGDNNDILQDYKEDGVTKVRLEPSVPNVCQRTNLA